MTALPAALVPWLTGSRIWVTLPLRAGFLLTRMNILGGGGASVPSIPILPHPVSTATPTDYDIHVRPYGRRRSAGVQKVSLSFAQLITYSLSRARMSDVYWFINAGNKISC